MEPYAGLLIREISEILVGIGALLVLFQHLQKNRELLKGLLIFDKDATITITLSEVVLWVIIFALTGFMLFTKVTYGF